MPYSDKEIIKNLMDSDAQGWPEHLRRARPDDPGRGVDPGTDAAIRARIARARPRAANRPFKIAVPAAAAALVLLVAGYYMTGIRGPAVPRMQLVDAPGPATALPEGNPAALELAAGRILYISLGAETFLRLIGPGSYTIERGPGRATVNIDRGDLLFVAAKNTKQPDLVLVSPAGRYEKTGTTARLRVRDSGDMLEVLKGSLRLHGSASAAPVEIKAGEVLRTRAGEDANGGAKVERLAVRAQERLAAESARLAARSQGSGGEGGRHGIDLAEMKSIYGEIHRVHLESGDVLEGHLFTRESRMYLMTPAGTRSLDELSIVRIQALP